MSKTVLTKRTGVIGMVTRDNDRGPVKELPVKKIRYDPIVDQ